MPFTVASDCADCLIAGFARPPGNPAACNATVSPTHPAELTMVVRPTVDLAGLEGTLRLQPPALRVTKLEPVGPAAGMTLDWTATPEGARFVLFAQHGAPIPALSAFPDPSSRVDPIAWPVLRMTVEQPPDVEAPEATVVGTAELLGSDIDGRGVSLCPPPPCRVPVPADWPIDPWFPSGRAVICAEQHCDFNADGREDVRDLVGMVHCLNGEGPCPPDAGTRFDCDADQTFTLADVICCARQILKRPPCPGCPRDSVRPERAVAVRFGAPVETADGVELPLHLDGADRLGAATLTLDAPLDRYDLAGVELQGSARWMALTETREGRIVLGLLNTWSGDFRADPNLDLRLRFSLRPGETPGGQVSAVAGEFSGGDGVLLGVDLGAPRQDLPGPPQLALSASRPNPFSSETRFTLDLVQAADVSVGIYDLRGRAVAILFRGRLPSGPQEFRWDGRRDGGSAAPEGVYFYRATVAGRTLARKLILMRSN